MYDLIRLADKIAERNAADPDCLSTDSQGVPIALFEIQYRHDGRTFVADIFARDFEDAQARVQSIRDTITLSGQIVHQSR